MPLTSSAPVAPGMPDPGPGSMPAGPPPPSSGWPLGPGSAPSPPPPFVAKWRLRQSSWLYRMSHALRCVLLPCAA
eukprot:2785117-Prymnesium_polylepis.1